MRTDRTCRLRSSYEATCAAASRITGRDPSGRRNRPVHGHGRRRSYSATSSEPMSSVFRLALPVDWQLDPDRAARPRSRRDPRSRRSAGRLACWRILSQTISTAISASRQATATRQFIDLYLYDQAAGGAGFVKAAARDPQRLVDRRAESARRLHLRRQLLPVPALVQEPVRSCAVRPQDRRRSAARLLQGHAARYRT